MLPSKSLITLITLAVLTSCVPPQQSAMSWYDQCVQKTPPLSFIKAMECGKSKRDAYCVSQNECTATGNAIVAYADSLVRSVKKHELTEEEARRKWLEFKMTRYQADAQAYQYTPATYGKPMPLPKFKPSLSTQPSMPPTSGYQADNGLMNSYIQPPPVNSGMGQGAQGYNGTTYIPAGADPNPSPDVYGR